MALKKHAGLNLESYVHTTEEMNEVSEQLIQFFSSLAESAEKGLPSWLPQGLHISEMVSSAMSFVIVPLIYLSSFLANEKVPFNLNNNARWLYSAALLGLTIAAFAVPGVAPILAISAASLSFAVASFILVKTVQKWREKRKEEGLLRDEISALKKENEQLEVEIHTMQAKLSLAVGEEKNDLQMSLNELSLRLQTNESLLEEKEAASKLGNKNNHLNKILDKSAGVLFASMGVVGFALALAIPPVGIAILTGTFAASLAYTLSRVIYSGINYLRAKNIKVAEDEEPAVVEQEPSSAFDLASKESLNHSTINMMNALHATSTHENLEENVHASKAPGNSIFTHEKEDKNRLAEEEHINSIPH